MGATQPTGGSSSAGHTCAVAQFGGPARPDVRTTVRYVGGAPHGGGTQTSGTCSRAVRSSRAAAALTPSTPKITTCCAARIASLPQRGSAARSSQRPTCKARRTAWPAGSLRRPQPARHTDPRGSCCGSCCASARRCGCGCDARRRRWARPRRRHAWPGCGCGCEPGPVRPRRPRRQRQAPPGRARRPQESARAPQRGQRRRGPPRSRKGKRQPQRGPPTGQGLRVPHRHSRRVSSWTRWRRWRARRRPPRQTRPTRC